MSDTDKRGRPTTEIQNVISASLREISAYAQEINRLIGELEQHIVMCQAVGLDPEETTAADRQCFYDELKRRNQARARGKAAR